MSPKQIAILAVVVVVVLGGFGLTNGMIGINDGQNWVYLQHFRGEVVIVDNPGMYWKWFGKTWTYPRYVEFRYNDDPDDGDKQNESIKVTFNDSGEADISTYIRLATPILEEDRISFHQQFGGNMDNIKASIKSHMIYCLKSTAPLMSSSGNQSARKAEFQQVVEGQFQYGKYNMRKEAVILTDNTDKTGNTITTYKTKIVVDKNGMPVIVKISPITEQFKMKLVQFSVTGTVYDAATRRQFAAKQESYLLTETAKANREKETQDRLMIVEKGLRQKAEAEASANVIKVTAVIAAELKAEVAMQEKIQAETVASAKLSVAKLDKQTLLMDASARFEQAQIKAKTAQELKKAMIAKAEGKKQAIELSGDITEIEQALINADVDKARFVSENFAKIQVPRTMIISGKEGSDGSSVMANMINLWLMKQTGILDHLDVNRSVVERQITR